MTASERTISVLWCCATAGVVPLEIDILLHITFLDLFSVALCILASTVAAENKSLSVPVWAATTVIGGRRGHPLTWAARVDGIVDVRAAELHGQRFLYRAR